AGLEDVRLHGPCHGNRLLLRRHQAYDRRARHARGRGKPRRPERYPCQRNGLEKPLRSSPPKSTPNAETFDFETGARPSVGPAGWEMMFVSVTGSPPSSRTRVPV